MCCSASCFEKEHHRLSSNTTKRLKCTKYIWRNSQKSSAKHQGMERQVATQISSLTSLHYCLLVWWLDICQHLAPPGVRRKWKEIAWGLPDDVPLCDLLTLLTGRKGLAKQQEVEIDNCCFSQYILSGRFSVKQCIIQSGQEAKTINQGLMNGWESLKVGFSVQVCQI